MSESLIKKAVDAYRAADEILTLRAENQRLRAALEMTKSELRWGDPTNAIERVERIIDEALSTTTEPTKSDQDKTCVMCGTREGKYLSTANRWFCEPCTDALPPVTELVGS